LQLFDEAMLADRPVLVAARLDGARLGAGGAVPPILRDRVTGPGRRLVADSDTAVSLSGLAERLQGLSPEQRHNQLVELVCTNAATVLGRSVADIGPDLAFQDLGLDSLTAVELRNRLKNATGLTLSPTAIFDHPTLRALAGHLDEQLSSVVITAGTAAKEPDKLARFNDIARELQTHINQPDWTTAEKAGLTARLQTILADLATPETTPEPRESDIGTAAENELLAILDEDFPV
jgi:acyl carrier protein